MQRGVAAAGRLPRIIHADANGRLVGPFGAGNPEAAEVWEDEIRRLFGRYLKKSRIIYKI
jgi:hypothetical protein